MNILYIKIKRRKLFWAVSIGKKRVRIRMLNQKINVDWAWKNQDFKMLLLLSKRKTCPMCGQRIGGRNE